jgi:hypothetical protein
MEMSKGREKKSSALEPTVAAGPKCWLQADYHFHVFHYRMPETVAIASVTPFVPSPLTVKMALIASLLQSGDDNSAKKLAPLLPQIEVRIVPPSSAFSFKAFLRYRSVPAVESAGGLDETGSYYPSRPHTREYALLEDKIKIILGLPDTSRLEIVKTALRNIRYLGCKDSLVTCLSVEDISEEEANRAPTVQLSQEGISGSVILGADFKSSASPSLRELIPGSRIDEHYHRPPPVFVLPGKILVKGRTRLFIRNRNM